MSFIIISKNRTYVYLKTEILLFTLENGDIVIYAGKRKYFYLQWNTEILFILEKRTYSYLYWKTHISLFILENGYIAIPTCPLTV